MKNIEKIKKDLLYGDTQRIALMVGCSIVYVRDVIAGRREIRSKKSREIYDAAKKVVDFNRKSLNKIEKSISEL